MPAWWKVAAVDYKYTDDRGWEPSPFKKEGRLQNEERLRQELPWWSRG